MGLREIAEADLSGIVENTDHFGHSITLTSPAGLAKTLIGYTNDIGLVISPDTGLAMSGRSVSLSLRISSILNAGFTDLPDAVADRAGKPWIVSFSDLNGSSHMFKVRSSMPDRSIGLLVLILERYN